MESQTFVHLLTQLCLLSPLSIMDRRPQGRLFRGYNRRRIYRFKEMDRQLRRQRAQGRLLRGYNRRRLYSAILVVAAFIAYYNNWYRYLLFVVDIVNWLLGD